MTTVDRVWRRTVIALAVLGCFLGLLTTPVSGLVWTGIVAAVLAEATAFGIRGSAEPGTPVPMVLRAGRVGPAAAVLLVGATGLVRLLGVPGVVLVLLVALSCPAVLRPALRLLGRHVGSPPALEMLAPAKVRQEPALPSPPTPPTAAFGDLATDELILAWRLSFTMLRRARTSAERARIAARRCGYLDELERRDPVAVQRWFSHGARAASDPTRYFSHRKDDDSHRHTASSD